MNWYNGNIAEAVAKSKANNAIFVVYVEGKDESATKLTNFINSRKIREKLESDDFVAIKIESDSQSYMQFATIYQVVPVPSIFFIGKSGTPLEIGTGIIASVEELEEKINKVLTSSGRCTSAVNSSTSFIEAEQKAQSPPASSTVTSKNEPEEEVPIPSLSAEPSTSSSAMEIDNKVQHDEEQEIVCDGDVCYKKPKETKAEKEIVVNKEAKSSIDLVDQNEMDTNARLEETRRNMEEQRRKRLAEEKQLEKEHELRRRQERKEFQNAQEWQREHELKELKENIRREKLEEMAARERIRAQIAADRAERAQKFASIGEGVANANAATTSAEDNSNSGGGPLLAPDSTRIQFRFASGNTATHVFNCQDTLGKIREYVRNDLLPGTGIKDFSLATTYPKRELNVEHDPQTLAGLNLFPSAVILIIGKESKSSPAAIIARSGGLLNMFTTLVMTILSPVFSIFGYIKNIATGDKRRNDNETDKNVGAAKRANEENGAHHDAAKRRNMERFGGGGITAGSVLGNNPSTSTEAATEKGETKPYRRYGSSNIHRLTDHKDSDDENATWNGNSTQQQ